MDTLRDIIFRDVGTLLLIEMYETSLELFEPLLLRDRRWTDSRYMFKKKTSVIWQRHPKSLAFGAQKHACITRLDEDFRKLVVENFMATPENCYQDVVNLPGKAGKRRGKKRAGELHQIDGQVPVEARGARLRRGWP